MNYLFFDIECANNHDCTGKVCEFGYVLTDESLSVLEKDIFLINPDSEFEQYVIHKIISYKVSDYKKSPKYPEVYEKRIKSLLNMPSTVYVGHGINNDIKFLFDESERYSLPKPSLYAIDASVIWQRYHKEKNQRNLKKLVAELGLGNPKAIHNSEYDALMTLEYIRLLCQKSGMSLSELANKYFPEEERQELKNYQHHVQGKSNDKAPSPSSKRGFRALVPKIEPIGERSTALLGKKVTVSDLYRTKNYNELLKLIGLIKAQGGEYELYAERSDIYCTFEAFDENGSKLHDNKLGFVKSAILGGNSIKVMPLDDLLDLLGVSHGELQKIPNIDTSALFKGDTQPV